MAKKAQTAPKRTKKAPAKAPAIPGRRRRGARKPPQGRIGARGKLCPEVRDTIASLIRAGAYPEPAARQAGVSPATYYGWRQRGERVRENIELGKDVSEDDRTYLDFLEAIEKAEAACENAAAAKLMTLGDRNAKAIVEFLARRYARRWGTRQTIEHAGAVDTRGGIDVSGLDDQKLAQLEALLEEAAVAAASAGAAKTEGR